MSTNEDTNVVLQYTELADLTIPGESDDADPVKLPTGVSVAGYAWSKDDKCFVKIDKDADGPEKLVLAAPAPVEGEGDVKPKTTVAAIKAAETEGKCLPGHVKNDEGKCVPIKEALDESKAKIVEMASSIKVLTDAARLANITTTVDSQIAAGHVLPVQRDKAINFMAGLPDDQHDNLLGIFGDNKFPLGDAGTVLPGSQRDGDTIVKIGDSETVDNMTDEDRAELRKRFGLDILIKNRGVE